MERRKRRTALDKYLDGLTDSPEKLNRCSEFYSSLRNYYKRKWGCPLKPPHIQGVEVNLFRLYDTVVSLGGWQKVSLNEKWDEVAKAIGVTEKVAVAPHAVKLIYMRFLLKYEQNELVGDVDDADSEIMGSRGRSKGFSSFATADCPVNSNYRRPACDNYRGQPVKKEAEYDRIAKSLLSGLPNEVDFAVNVCTLLSHPGPRVLRLTFAPQIITLLVAHVAIFPDGDVAFFELYKHWQEVSKHDFISFWSGAGIEDEEVLKLIPHVKISKERERDKQLFPGIDPEFQPRNAVSWRVQQVVSIMRNLSFEVINKAVMAASWPLLKFLLVCSNSKWSLLRTAALDALSNIACEIELVSEESSTSNHLLLKTVSRCLHSDDKLQIIRALEIISGLCNNERNESLLCEFLDTRILSKIFSVIAVKDIMMCVYTLESLYQISELGASACNQISIFPHAIDTLVNLATIEAVSFGPSGLVGMKVVEFHTPSQFTQTVQQSVTPTTRQVTPVVAAVQPQARSPVIRTPIHPTAMSDTPTSPSVSHLSDDDKVKQMTARWIRLNCVQDMGHVIPRGELYATYVEDIRKHYHSLSGSLQSFTNILKSIFPATIVKTQANYSSIVFENVRYSKNHGQARIADQTSSTMSPSPLATNYPLVQKMLNENTTSYVPVNGHIVPSAISVSQDRLVPSGILSVAPAINIRPDEMIAVNNTSHATSSVPSTSMAATGQQPLMTTGNNRTSQIEIDGRKYIGDFGRHEARIVRVENPRSVESGASTPTYDNAPTTSYVVVKQSVQSPQRKSLVTRRYNGMIEANAAGNRVNGAGRINGFSDATNVVAFSNQNGSAQNLSGPEFGVVVTIAPGISVPRSCASSSSSRNDDNESTCSSSNASSTQSPSAKRRRTSARPTTSFGSGEYVCEWNGCGRHFSTSATMLHHCATDHLSEDHVMQCQWPRCDSTPRAKWSMVTHLQDHHCNEAALKAALQRRKEGVAAPVGSLNSERQHEVIQHPGYAKNAAVEAIRRHAFNYLPRDITDDPEGPVTKSIRLTSCLILRNLARYSSDGRRLLRRHERLLSWLALSRVESSSSLAQLLAEFHAPSASDSEPLHRSTSNLALSFHSISTPSSYT